MKTKSIAVAAFFITLLYVLTAGPAGATTYTLTLSAQGPGTVEAFPTNSTYPAGVGVTLTATPSNGWYFANWSGDTNGSVNPLEVAMYSNLVITGNFLAYPIYTLTLATNGQGAIALNPPGGSYFSNTVVTATATPATGWVFAGWSGPTNATTNVVSLAVDANNLLTGAFAQLPAFDAQPGSVTNQPGSTVNFTAQAVGNAPLGYNWFFNGSPLAGATNASLSLTNCLAALVGNYWVVATNSYGSTTSQVAALTLTNLTPATQRVNSLDEGSLLAAIAQGGWVGFGLSGPVTITNTINLTNHVILDGGVGGIILNGGNAVRLFNVAGGASLTATNLTLAGGEAAANPADGGMLYNNGGGVSLIGCSVINNSAQSLNHGGLARGGAIFNNAGTVYLLQTTVSNNVAVAGLQAYTGAGLGGAIYTTNGSVTIAGCTVSTNVCIGSTLNGSAMGGALFQAAGSTAISGSVFTLNQAASVPGGDILNQPNNSGCPAYGGAVAVNGGGLMVNESQFIANAADGGSVGIGYGSGASAFGGAVYSAATLAINDCSLTGNQAFSGKSINGYLIGPLDGFGGAICNSGTAAMNRCLVSSNYVQGGTVASKWQEATQGARGLGGGIYNTALFAATNCTVALNTAFGGLGAGSPPSDQFAPPSIGNCGNALGGGIFNNAGATFLAMNLTIASNGCLSLVSTYVTNGFNAGFQLANATNGTLSIHNTLVAGTTNAWGPITDGGYNICSDGSAGLFSGSSYDSTDPQLAPLGNYGGPTWCMALLPDSPAIDLGDFNGCPNTDQRGYVRPIGSAPDEGAYEYGSAPLVIPNLSISPSGTNVLLSFTAAPPLTYYLLCSTNLTSWTCLCTNGSFASQTNLSQTLGKQGFNRRYFRLLMQ